MRGKNCVGGMLQMRAKPLNWAGILMHFPAAHSPPPRPTPFQPFRAILVISPIPAKAKASQSFQIAAGAAAFKLPSKGSVSLTMGAATQRFRRRNLQK